jgi:TetR/AcrR family transcriptional repressor of nem operon
MNIKHNKEQVLKTGLHLFCERGYTGLGVDEICKITGMTKGAFYHAFKSKEQFLVEAIALYGENNVRRIHTQLLPNNQFSAIERLENFYIQMLEAQPKTNFTGCFINNIMSELGSISPNIGKLANNEFDKFVDAIEMTVKEAQEKGQLKNNIPSKEVTELLHSTFYGLLTRAKSSQDNQQSIKIINLLFENLKK